MSRFYKEERQFSFPQNLPGIPGFPGGGFPPQPPTQPPGGPGQPPMQPPTLPPTYIPQQSQAYSTLAIAPGSLRLCLFRWTYVWLSNGDQFWIWPFSVRQQTVTFFRHIPFFGYTLGGLDTRRIAYFICTA
ncbi:hypothetical protein [Aneurinibacillus aneurinilyticus]|nr:hypothetical protein [Aneurinibacillus aneurinilyticus]MCI1694377.1 collagen-like protein [Aneurinibacillus aneurinilyticus]MED0671558.1 collagen-like protein [Aneurinibacillus aneurinilyticus]MED0705369.1 collagen-like protein [Aneurinibacillus aneurinilyticus]MED0725012.1 collagen-like protein [Aneurinibacillus aneurinilyticus]MED0730966.1 collagen-like protein [Aneurinibacillus aneurinilyticus]